jgi:hypothetical protein
MNEIIIASILRLMSNDFNYRNTNRRSVKKQNQYRREKTNICKDTLMCWINKIDIVKQQLIKGITIIIFSMLPLPEYQSITMQSNNKIAIAI